MSSMILICPTHKKAPTSVHFVCKHIIQKPELAKSAVREGLLIMCKSCYVNEDYKGVFACCDQCLQSKGIIGQPNNKDKG